MAIVGMNISVTLPEERLTPHPVDVAATDGERINFSVPLVSMLGYITNGRKLTAIQG
jgi:hypothetical protein